MITLTDKSIFENRKYVCSDKGLIDQHYKDGDFKWQKRYRCQLDSLPPQPLICKYTSWEFSEEYYYFKRVNQDYLSIDYVMEGRLYFRQKNEAYIAEPGDAVILHPHFNTFLMHLDKAPILIYGFCLQGYLLPALLKELQLEKCCGISIRNREAFQNCCKNLFQSMKSSETEEDRMIISKNSFELLSRLASENQIVSQDDMAEQVESYLRKSISSKIEISKLPNIFNISLPTLNSRFFKVYHQTPLQYLKHLRLEHAFKLLQSTNYSIKEIAFSCGFNSPQSFCKDFFKQTGTTPGTFRNERSKFRKPPKN